MYTTVFGKNRALTAAVASMIKNDCLCFPVSGEGGIPRGFTGSPALLGGMLEAEVLFRKEKELAHQGW